MCTTKTEGRKDNEKIKSNKSRQKKARCVNKLYAYLVQFCHTPWFCFPKCLSHSVTGRDALCSSLLPFLRSIYPSRDERQLHVMFVIASLKLTYVVNM